MGYVLYALIVQVLLLFGVAYLSAYVRAVGLVAYVYLPWIRLGEQLTGGGGVEWGGGAILGCVLGLVGYSLGGGALASWCVERVRG